MGQNQNRVGPRENSLREFSPKGLTVPSHPPLGMPTMKLKVYGPFEFRNETPMAIRIDDRSEVRIPPPEFLRREEGIFLSPFKKEGLSKFKGLRTQNLNASMRWGRIHSFSPRMKNQAKECGSELLAESRDLILNFFLLTLWP